MPVQITCIQWTRANTAQVEAAIPGRFRLSAEPGKDAEVYDRGSRLVIGLKCACGG